MIAAATALFSGGKIWIIAAAAFLAIAGYAAYERQSAAASDARATLAQHTADEATASLDAIKAAVAREQAADADRAARLQASQAETSSLREALSHAPKSTNCASSATLSAVRQRLRGPTAGANR